jgi:iron complex transport system substrate-binding protein
MVVLLLASALLNAPTAPPERLGKAAELAPGAAKRIVSLAPSFTEILFALGAGSRVVGVTRFCDWPLEARRLPKVGGFVDADPEAVLALAPDLVVTAPAPGARERIERLARLGASVLVLPTEGIDDLWQAILVLGQAVARERESNELTLRLQKELEAMRATTERAAPVQVLMIVGHRPLVAAGPGSFLDALLGYVNAKNAVRRAGPLTAAQPFVHLDLEAIAAARPDVIVDASFGEPAPDGFWERLRTAMGAAMPRIARVTQEELVRPGPRLPVGLRALAAAVRTTP